MTPHVQAQTSSATAKRLYAAQQAARAAQAQARRQAAPPPAARRYRPPASTLPQWDAQQARWRAQQQRWEASPAGRAAATDARRDRRWRWTNRLTDLMVVCIVIDCGVIWLTGSVVGGGLLALEAALWMVLAWGLE
jgi:hypothetical protein